MAFSQEIKCIEKLLAHALSALNATVEIKINRSKNKQHGDFFTNMALLLAKQNEKAPLELAELIVNAIPEDPAVERIAIAGPGFINFFMHKSSLTTIISRILSEKEQFGHSCSLSAVSLDSLDAVQYAHARICTVLRQLQEWGFILEEEKGLAGLTQLTEPYEVSLMIKLGCYPEVVEVAASQAKPHLLAYYLRELANGLHSYYNAIILLCEDKQLSDARLCLLMAIRQVLRNGLKILGVSTPESM